MSADIDFDPNIPVSRLPPNWSLKASNDRAIRLTSPDGQEDYVILQANISGADYSVQPMVESDRPHVRAENDASRFQTFTDLSSAVDYALDVANQLAQ